jgi:hypothetical protein
MALKRDYDVRVNGYGDFHGNIFKKVGHALTAPIKQNKLGKAIGRVAQASLLPLAVVAKPLTVTAAAIGRATHNKALQKPDKAATKFWNYTRTHPLTILGLEAAAVGAGVAIASAGPAAAASSAAAAPATTTATVATTATASTTATAATTAAAGGTAAAGTATSGGLIATATTIAKEKIEQVAKEKAKAALTSITTGKSVSTPGQQPGQPGGPPIVPLAAAAGGFAVGGPVGAVVGGIVGYFIARGQPSASPSTSGSNAANLLALQAALVKADAANPPPQMTEAQAAEGGV